MLEMDSSSVVALLQKNTCNHPYSTLNKKIQQLLTRNWEVKVSHVYREANRAADFLSSLGHSLPLGLHVYFETSIGFREIFVWSGSTT